ncbi:MAG: sulfite exporter TauE/SafE family protein [Oscillospiraceae bacterium]|nr:sulfite exporter TauE/SafE family protein [Oscillospiraceae bacterium]MBQ6901633.1 sulfite exporter TauE/SafE family protein [Oscillospiraceae bacterium]
MEFVLNMLAGAVTGIITGFGVGGGTLLILYLTMFRGTSQLAAQGINLLYFIPTAGCALVSHIKNKRIVWRAVIFSASAGLVTTVIAAFIAARLDMTLLRRIFGGFLLLIGISELFNKQKTER